MLWFIQTRTIVEQDTNKFFNSPTTIFLETKSVFQFNIFIFSVQDTWNRFPIWLVGRFDSIRVDSICQAFRLNRFDLLIVETGLGLGPVLFFKLIVKTLAWLSLGYVKYVICFEVKLKDNNPTFCCNLGSSWMLFHVRMKSENILRCYCMYNINVRVLWPKL